MAGGRAWGVAGRGALEVMKWSRLTGEKTREGGCYYLQQLPGGEDRGPGGERSHLDLLDHLAGINDDLSACHPFRNSRLEPQILCWPWHTPVDQRYQDGGVLPIAKSLWMTSCLVICWP